MLPFLFSGRKDFEAKKWSSLKRSLRLTAVTKKSGLKSNISQTESDTPPKKEGALPNIFLEKKIFDKIKSESPKISKKTPRISGGDHDKNRNYSEI